MTITQDQYTAAVGMLRRHNVHDFGQTIMRLDALFIAADTVGKWLSAALDDPHVCAEMKADITKLFDEMAKSPCYGEVK